MWDCAILSFGGKKLGGGVKMKLGLYSPSDITSRPNWVLFWITGYWVLFFFGKIRMASENIKIPQLLSSSKSIHFKTTQMCSSYGSLLSNLIAFVSVNFSCGQYPWARINNILCSLINLKLKLWMISVG